MENKKTYAFADFKRVYAKDMRIGDMLLDGPIDDNDTCLTIPIQDITKDDNGVSYYYQFDNKSCVSTVHPLRELYILKENVK